MMKITVLKTPTIITATQFQKAVRRGLQNVKQFTAGNPNSITSGLIRAEMNKPKSGRIYPVIVKNRKRYLNHQASNGSGNESSAILSGRLAKSIQGKTEGFNRLIISSNTPYSRIQENGGINSFSNKNYWLSSVNSPIRNKFAGMLIARRNNIRRPIISNRGKIKNIISRELNNIK